MQLIGTKEMHCPFCGKEEELFVVEKNTAARLEGKTVMYKELSYLCKVKGNPDGIFQTSELMDQNHQKAKAAHKAMKMMEGVKRT